MNHNFKSIALTMLCLSMICQATEEIIPQTHMQWCTEVAALATEEQEFFLHFNSCLAEVFKLTQTIEQTALPILWKNYPELDAHYTIAPYKLLGWIGSEIEFWQYIDQKTEHLSQQAQNLLNQHREFILETYFDYELLNPEEMTLAKTLQWEIKLIRLQHALQKCLFALNAERNNETSN